jgi:hypothetical protein
MVLVGLAVKDDVDVGVIDLVIESVGVVVGVSVMVGVSVWVGVIVGDKVSVGVHVVVGLSVGVQVAVCQPHGVSVATGGGLFPAGGWVGDSLFLQDSALAETRVRKVRRMRVFRTGAPFKTIRMEGIISEKSGRWGFTSVYRKSTDLP